MIELKLTDVKSCAVAGEWEGKYVGSLLERLKRIAVLIYLVMFISPNQARTPSTIGLIFTLLLTPTMQVRGKKYMDFSNATLCKAAVVS